MTTAVRSRLYSEQQPALDCSYEELMRLMYQDQPVNGRIALEGGVFLLPEFAYALLRTPPRPPETGKKKKKITSGQEEVDTGARILAMARHPENFMIHDREIRDDEANKYFVIEKGKHVALKPGYVFKSRLKFDERNTGQVFALTAKPRAEVDNWLHEYADLVAVTHRAFGQKFGTLKHHGSNVRISGGIVYWWEKSKKNKEKFDLFMTVAPRATMDLETHYDTVFKGLRGKFIKAASLRKTGLSKSEINTFIKQDFGARTSLYLAGMDPYTLPFNDEEKPKGKLGYVKRTLGRAFRTATLYGTYGSTHIFSKEMGIAVGLNLVLNVGIYYTMHGIGWAVTPLGIGGKAITQIGARAGKRVKDFLGFHDDVLQLPESADIMRQVAHHKPQRVWGSPLREDDITLSHLRMMPHNELTSGEVYPVQELTWDTRVSRALNNIWRLMPSQRRGKHMSGFRVGAYKGLLLDTQTGLKIEHIRDLNTRFVRLEESEINERLLPADIIKLFRNNKDRGPILELSCNRKDQVMENKFITLADYKKKIEAIKKLPYKPLIQLEPEPVFVPLPMPPKEGWISWVANKLGLSSITPGAEAAAQEIGNFATRRFFGNTPH